MTGQVEPRDDGTVAAVLRLVDLAGKIERVENAVTRRVDELARDCVAAREQVDGLSGAFGALGSRAEDIDRRLTEVSTLLGRMSGQISALTTPPGEAADDDLLYRVNQPPPWWKPADQRCQDTAGRLADWVQEVYRPVYGYLADLLAPCWRRHPLCLAYLDVLHEAWCLLYLNERDPKMVFAQLDWLPVTAASRRGHGQRDQTMPRPEPPLRARPGRRSVPGCAAAERTPLRTRFRCRKHAPGRCRCRSESGRSRRQDPNEREPRPRPRRAPRTAPYLDM